MARKPTIQDVFMQHFDEVCQSGKLSAPQQRAAQAILACRSPAMGGHEQRCPDGHFARTQYHSCKHRSCPTCAEKAKHEWLEKEQSRLLPCDHFHAIFTVPHELLGLWRYNRRAFTDILFAAVRDTLLQLLGQERHLGARPGIVMALHTWGRTLNQHPHIHCLVTAGGMTADGHWRDVAGDYLLPAAVVKAIYRGKLLAYLTAALHKHRLCPPGADASDSVESMLRRAGAKKWNVRIESCYGHGRGVTKYLSRYVRGGPIANTRIVDCQKGMVRFRYRDHRDGKSKLRTLGASRFLEQLLWHVPEPGQHHVRHVGLYAHSCKARREACRLQIDPGAQPAHGHTSTDWRDYLRAAGAAHHTACPHCGRSLVRGLSIPHRRRGRQNSQTTSARRPPRAGPYATRRSTGTAVSRAAP